MNKLNEQVSRFFFASTQTTPNQLSRLGRCRRRQLIEIDVDQAPELCCEQSVERWQARVAHILPATRRRVPLKPHRSAERRRPPDLTIRRLLVDDVRAERAQLDAQHAVLQTTPSIEFARRRATCPAYVEVDVVRARQVVERCLDHCGKVFERRLTLALERDCVASWHSIAARLHRSMRGT